MESINVESQRIIQKFEGLGVSRKRQFWRRQFAKESTRGQVIFDGIVGLALPSLCLFFDPIVFRSGMVDKPILGKFQLFAYAVIILETLAMVAWLTCARSQVWASALGAVMLTGAFFSFVVGFVILPFSLLGLMFLIGVLGFIPFLTAFVFLRNGLRALKSTGEYFNLTALFAPLVLGAAFALGAPAAIQWSVASVISSSLNDVINGTPQQAATATNRLRLASLIATDDKFDALITAYGDETDNSRRVRLAQAYRDITGDEIVFRREMLAD